MWTYVAKRLVLALPTALGVTVICFLMVHLAPGDPVMNLLPPGAPPADVAMIKAAYGLDQPLLTQFALWLGHAVVGDLGQSIQTHQPVLTEVGLALGNTIFIATVAVCIALSLSIVLGSIAAYRQGGLLDRLATGIAVLGISTSSFWLGIVLVIVFAVELGWLPATGVGHAGSGWLGLMAWDNMKYAVLPVVTMTLTPLGILTRTVRAALLEVLGQDFIIGLRAKGMRPLSVTRHALRNAAPQIMAMFGIQFGYLLGGSILVETIFSWPGTGFLINRAILTRDVPMLQGAVLVLSLLFVAINLIVDLAQSVVDPRIQRT